MLLQISLPRNASCVWIFPESGVDRPVIGTVVIPPSWFQVMFVEAHFVRFNNQFVRFNFENLRASNGILRTTFHFINLDKSKKCKKFVWVDGSLFFFFFFRLDAWCRSICGIRKSWLEFFVTLKLYYTGNVITVQQFFEVFTVSTVTMRLITSDKFREKPGSVYRVESWLEVEEFASLFYQFSFILR